MKLRFFLPPRSRPSSSNGIDRTRGRVERTRTIFALTLLVGTGSVIAHEPQVRATLNAQADIWVGQRVILVIELLAPGFFSSAPAFDLPDPRGLLLVPPSQSPVLSTEEINGASYTVQRHEMSIFAQRPGDWTIPSLTLRFSFKRNPMDKESVAATVKTQPIHFTAKMPPGAEKLGTILSARNLTAVESWNPEPGKAKAGDAFTRMIIFSAPDIPAMAFPPFPTRPVDGLGIYPKAPEIFDHNDRGRLLGERHDTITYVCQRPGHFVIPGARLTWWDLDSTQLRTVDFPARVFDVAPNPAMEAAVTEQGFSERSLVRWLVAAFVAVVLLGVFLFRRKLRPILRYWLDVWRPVHLQPLNPTA